MPKIVHYIPSSQPNNTVLCTYEIFTFPLSFPLSTAAVPAAPDAPTLSEITDHSMMVSWQPPVNDGGSPVLEYILEHKILTDVRWSSVAGDKIISTNFAAEGLRTGKEYQFRVSAVNKAGKGDWSKPSSDALCKAPLVGEPPQLLEPLDSFTLLMPDTAEFFCDIALGTPKSELTWYKDGKEIGTDKRFTMEYNERDEAALLFIKDTRLSDAGVYKVVAKNALGEVQSESTLTVHQTPKFIIDDSVKKDFSIRANSSLNLEGSFRGYPEPTVEWTLEEKPVSSEIFKVGNTSDFTRLSGRKLNAEFAGHYKCTITNASGFDTMHYIVAVIDVPSAPQNVAVTNITKDSVGVEWKRPLSDGGSPILQYNIERKDMKRNTWVTAGNCAQDKLAYIVKKLAKGGEYSIRVSAENDVGEGPATEIEKPVMVKDQFTVPSAPLDLEVNDVTVSTANLNWGIPEKDGGAPIIGYVVERKSQFAARWTRVNKQPVPGTVMKIVDLTEGSQYEFRVIAENKAGNSKPSNIAGPITAKEPVVPIHFTNELMDITVKEDMPAVFECEINKSGMTPKWRKNGMVLEPSSKFVMTSNGNKYFLTVNECQPRDEAGYEVVFDDTSSIASLSVDKEAVEIVQHLEDISLHNTPENAVFKCEVSKPNLAVKWIKDGQSIEESSKYSISTSGCAHELIVKSAADVDEGEYTILVKGLTSKARLSVQIKPTMKLDKKYEDTVILHAGKSTILEVPFQGYPRPEVVWNFDDRDLPKVRRLEVETTAALTCLRLKQAERSDSGDYSVRISNEYGTVTATIALVVLDKPEPPINLDASSVSESAVTISWKPPRDDGGSKITHYTVEKREANKRAWTMVGKAAESTTLLVDGLTEGVNYMFQVKAVNAICDSEPAELQGPITPTSKYGMLTILSVTQILKGFRILYNNGNLLSMPQ